MGLYSAYSIDAACSGAGIYAVVLFTCFVRRTVRVDNTFGLTCNVRVSEILRDALTCRGPISSVTDGIGATGRGVTGVYDFGGEWS